MGREKGGGEGANGGQEDREREGWWVGCGVGA